ncbi:MAG: PHP domain-containing protein [Alphaproteobacteria bacterium]|nr:PHP domain-containing protein [Alphaproteobacteria bacterium]
MLVPSLLAGLLLSSGCAPSDPFARAYEMKELKEGIGGPKASARPGDFVLENDRIRLAILGPDPSLGPHTSGGSLADADLQRFSEAYDDGNGNDRLAEVFATVNLNIAETANGAGTVAIVADGSDGGAAIVCVEGPYEPFITLLRPLWVLVNGPTFRMRTDYILEPGSPAVLVRSVATIVEDLEDDTGGCEGTLGDDIPAADGADTTLPIIELAMETGMVFGDFYLQGGSVDVFAPDIGFDEEGYVNDLSQAGANTFQDPIAIDFLAGTADGVSYGTMPTAGRTFVPMFTSSQTVTVGGAVVGDPDTRGRFDVGTRYRYDRWFAVGQGDVGSVVDALLEVRGDAVGRVQGYVVESGTGVALSAVHVFAFKPGSDAPYLEWTTDIGEDDVHDGSFGGKLPVGTWELATYAEGRSLSERVTVDVTDGGTVDLVLASPQPGSVSFQVRDGEGTIVPAKLTFFRADDVDIRDPVLGDSFIGGQPATVYFATYGDGQVVLPPGDYYAVASRGVEYELGISEVFTLTGSSHVDLDLTVVRTVDTSGWISADLHVHSVPSHDSGVSLEDRVGTMVSEGVEFFSSTDHDHVTDFAPTVQAMGLEEWVSTAVGLEVTTIEIGHYLGFPLRHDFLADQGGAFDWTGMTPQDIVDGIRDLRDPTRGEPVVFIGHPRDGILGYFDQYGLDHYESDGDEPLVDPGVLATLTGNDLLSADNFTEDFDALELLNGKRFELLRTPTTSELAAYAADPDSVSVYDMAERTMDEQILLMDGEETLGGGGHEGTIDDWFNLLNLGFRYTALGNSDTHGKTGVESGCPRNFVVSETDDPGFITPQAVADAVREGKVVASYGPFVRFWADSPDQGVGSTVVSSGEVVLNIEVQSPSWFDVERVEVYENGTLIAEYEIPTPNADPLNLYEQLPVSPDQDAWYVVIALGQDDMGPIFTPVEIPYIQLQDIVVDALEGVPGVSSLVGEAQPIPRAFPVHPFALTNPIWIDRDGDGFDPPGYAEWLRAPAE